MTCAELHGVSLNSDFRAAITATWATAATAPEGAKKQLAGLMHLPELCELILRLLNL